MWLLLRGAHKPSRAVAGVPHLPPRDLSSKSALFSLFFCFMCPVSGALIQSRQQSYIACTAVLAPSEVYDVLKGARPKTSQPVVQGNPEWLCAINSRYRHFWGGALPFFLSRLGACSWVVRLLPECRPCDCRASSGPSARRKERACLQPAWELELLNQDQCGHILFSKD